MCDGTTRGGAKARCLDGSVELKAVGVRADNDHNSRSANAPLFPSHRAPSPVSASRGKQSAPIAERDGPGCAAMDS